MADRFAELRKIEDYDKDGSRGPDFKSVRNNTLRTRRFVPQGPMKGLIFFIHGAGAHCHRPSDAACGKFFNSKGYGYFLFDSDAHGLSGGLYQDTPTHNEQVADAENYVKMITKEFPNLPYAISGESMGGAISLLLGHTLQKKSKNEEKGEPHAALFRGVAVIAPAIHNTLEPPSCVVACLRYCIVPCCPTTHAPTFVAGSITYDNIFRTEEAKKVAREDPLLVFEPFRFGAGCNLLDMTHAVSAAIPTINYPFFVAHGSGDQVIPLSGSEALYNGSATPKENKTLKTYKDGCHELYNDPYADEVRGDFLAFFDKHCV